MKDFCFFNLKVHGYDFGFNFPVCFKVEELIFNQFKLMAKLIVLICQIFFEF